MNTENIRKLLNPRSLAICGPNDKNNVYIYVSGTSFVRQSEEETTRSNPGTPALFGQHLSLSESIDRST